MFIPHILFQILFDTCTCSTQKKHKNLCIMSETTCKDASAIGMCNLHYVKKLFYHVLFCDSTLLAKNKGLHLHILKKLDATF